MEFKTLSCYEAGQFDLQNKLKEKRTRWYLVSELRREQGISRKQRIAKKKA